MEPLNGKTLRSTEEIGNLVRETRKAQGISQEQLAGVANTGIRFISDLENGKPTVQLEKTIRVLEALGLGVYAFYRWERS
ncbi:MAG: helix-turn-helix transcriptional regulator [Akkermansia sp.]|jgi:y4mF family transcriptional regulator|nr:helix-turn-helix transcriptional regulator [Akkermansia sp.]